MLICSLRSLKILLASIVEMQHCPSRRVGSALEENVTGAIERAASFGESWPQREPGLGNWGRAGFTNYRIILAGDGGNLCLIATS